MNSANNIQDFQERIHSALSTIQSPNNSRRALMRHDPTGLGAQISRRNLALRVALISGRATTFPNETLFPYTNPFEPLLEIEGKANIDAAQAMSNPFEAKLDGGTTIFFDFWKFWADQQARTKTYEYNASLFELESTTSQLLLDGCLYSWQKLTPEYASRIERKILEIQLPEKYIGIHFRRGDKLVETPYVPVEIYRENLIRESEARGIKDVYIASDSMHAPDDLNLEKYGLRSHFDAGEKRYNNANHRFLMANPELAAQETLTAMKNIALLGRGEAIVGQDNAHFATLAAGIIMCRKNSTDYGTLISGEIQIEQSFFWRSLYRGNKLLRATAKLLLRHRTMAHLSRHKK